MSACARARGDLRLRPVRLSFETGGAKCGLKLIMF